MSIRKDTYQFCKTVWSSPERERVRSLIKDLNTATEEQMRSGKHRANFGFAARQMQAQILGYLVVDRDKAKIEENYPPLRWTEPLTEEERQLLAGVHEQIVALDKSCVTPLTSNLPRCSESVDPYNVFRYAIPEDAEDVQVFSPENVEALAGNFHEHPAFPIALEIGLESAEVIEEHMPKDKLVGSVVNLEKALMQTGPLSAPRKLAEIAATQRRDSPQRLAFRYLSALTCIRASLAVLNELAFLAVTTNKLSVLTEENVIEFGALTKHLAGSGLPVLCQPNEQIAYLGIDLVLVKCPFLEYPYPTDLCRVEYIQHQQSNELGDIIEIQIREIDENLNPFPGLLQNI